MAMPWHLEAARLREEGLTYPQIAARLDKTLDAVSHAVRLLDPEKAERARKQRRAYKKRNPEVIRAQGRRRRANVKGTCSRCGGPISRERDGRVCRACLREVAVNRRDYIVRRHNEGASHGQVAAEIGSTTNAVGAQISRLRTAGYDLRDGRQRGSYHPSETTSSAPSANARPSPRRPPDS